MLTHNLGYPRIGSQRELKRACENLWAGKIDKNELSSIGQSIRFNNWKIQKEAGIDIIPCNDFSFYDHVLDHIVSFGAIPHRFRHLAENLEPVDLYFALSRGYQDHESDVKPMEMTKWFDTNYHYIVPEFEPNQQFILNNDVIINAFTEAKGYGIVNPKPVIIGPMSFLKLGKPKGKHFETTSLIHNLLPVYIELIGKLSNAGAEYIQIDEPYLCTMLSEKEKRYYSYVLNELFKSFPEAHFIIATYFGSVIYNRSIIEQLPNSTLHIDLIRSPEQLDDLLVHINENINLSLGIVDGRNIWKNDYTKSLKTIDKAQQALCSERLMIAPSCSLLHVPCDLDLENNERSLPPDIKAWMAFAYQKLTEINTLSKLADGNKYTAEKNMSILKKNSDDILSRNQSKLISDLSVQRRISEICEEDFNRKATYSVRHKKQKEKLRLPLLPTTTIGSFPQTKEIRDLRSRFKKGQITSDEYSDKLKTEIRNAIQLQEELDLDILVHGEFERNDMVEYFGEQLNGFAFTENGWVQSYGSRCVKPPVIFGDVSRPKAMTVDWIKYAQSLTSRPVKGMLTGPVTILQWSFVRDDQERSKTAMQIALAIRDEIFDLESSGINIIQVDEPALREGLPLHKSEWPDYLEWAVKAFRLSVSGVQPQTQIHTHMCYAEFNDIIQSIADMDADVITIECSRSQMELLDAFADFKYPHEIGPGIYDIHAPRIPLKEEIISLLEKAINVIPVNQLWVNPDCGLKTRKWEETKKSLAEMVAAAKELRQKYSGTV